MKTSLTILSLVLAAASASAEPLTFDFKDPKGVNHAAFKMDAPLETISGSASGISGKVTFDPAKPSATTGKIVVATETLTVGNAMMRDHMLSEGWMDAKKHPEITFEAKSLKNVKTEGDSTTADAVGTFTLKGITKEITVPVKLTYLKDKLAARMPNMKGDLLVIRSSFSIKRSDFNIQPGKNEDKVSDEIELTLSIAGYATR
ncbi:MAG TPA: YceI family protein [Verrucomicrobiae bacterium]|nr:YceI family protein [Verrucomicrobiae bacterium]